MKKSTKSAYFQPWFDHPWLRAKIAPNQVLILISWSKVKLHHAVLLWFGLKMSKIALNIVKVGTHSYFPNAHWNLWLNFNSNKLVKSETQSCTFLCVPIKWVSKSTFKFDFQEIGKKCNLFGLGLTKFDQGPNSSKSPKSVYVWLSLKWVPNSLSNFNYKKVKKK